jgi:hypothetical protein
MSGDLEIGDIVRCMGPDWRLDEKNFRSGEFYRVTERKPAYTFYPNDGMVYGYEYYVVSLRDYDEAAEEQVDASKLLRIKINETNCFEIHQRARDLEAAETAMRSMKNAAGVDDY